jgi:ArsR family transcriptional regulator
MESLHAAECLAALGHESRLDIFRLLVQAGPQGINAGAIGEKLGIPSTTLSFHLAHLSRVGLVSRRQDSRFIFYATDFGAMDDLIVFLTADCCKGTACLPKTAAQTGPKRTSPAKKFSRSQA